LAGSASELTARTEAGEPLDALSEAPARQDFR